MFVSSYGDLHVCYITSIRSGFYVRKFRKTKALLEYSFRSGLFDSNIRCFLNCALGVHWTMTSHSSMEYPESSIEWWHCFATSLYCALCHYTFRLIFLTNTAALMEDYIWIFSCESFFCLNSPKFNSSKKKVFNSSRQQSLVLNNIIINYVIIWMALFLGYYALISSLHYEIFQFASNAFFVAYDSSFVII